MLLPCTSTGDEIVSPVEVDGVKRDH
jgi:hypothetical protein